MVGKVISKAYDHPQNIIDEEKISVAPKGFKDMIELRNAIGNDQDSWKRKRKCQSSSEVLYWLTHAAKQPDDPAIGFIPECARWKNYGNEEFWAQALFVREALFVRRHTDANGCERLQKCQNKKPRMHPSLYEDSVLDHKSTEKLRSSQRIPFLAKPCLCPYCFSRAALQNGVNCLRKAKAVYTSKASLNPDSLKVITKADTIIGEEPAIELKVHKFFDLPAEKQVSVGPQFQAEVPEWTGECFESDSKWLGTRMWPTEDFMKKSAAGIAPIGKGRPHSCTCPFPASVECNRFHIAEKRFQLRRDIGLLFYHWCFDRMGEEVSLSWTKEEECRFKDMMRLYAASPNKFWNKARRFLPSKTRENMLSFYFNVYLIQRRSYQNRVTPKELDSDDDEKACGSVGDRFGYKALNIQDTDSVICVQNTESTELL